VGCLGGLGERRVERPPGLFKDCARSAATTLLTARTTRLAPKMQARLTESHLDRGLRPVLFRLCVWWLLAAERGASSIPYLGGKVHKIGGTIDLCLSLFVCFLYVIMPTLLLLFGRFSFGGKEFQ